LTINKFETAKSYCPLYYVHINILVHQLYSMPHTIVTATNKRSTGTFTDGSFGDSGKEDARSPRRIDIKETKLNTQYDHSKFVERQCSYCAYAFATYIDYLIHHIDFKNKKLSQTFIDNYNTIIDGASKVKKQSPLVTMMETFNSEFSQSVFNIHPSIVHMVLNPEHLPEYENVHNLYRSQFSNWQHVHNQKLSTPRIDIDSFRSILVDLVDPKNKLRFLIVNRFFMTFLIVPIRKTLINTDSPRESITSGSVYDCIGKRLIKKKQEISDSNEDCEVSIDPDPADDQIDTDYLILDSHYKTVYVLNLEGVVKYIDNSKDYNMVLIGKIF
jgi:hypothetical protein